MRTLYESILDAGFARRNNSIDINAKAGKALLKTIKSLHPRITRSDNKIRFDFASLDDMAHPERATRKIIKTIRKMMDDVQNSDNFNPSSDAQWTCPTDYFAACARQEDGQYIIIVAQNHNSLTNTFWIEVYKTKDEDDAWVNNLMRARWGTQTSPDTIYAIALYLGLEV